MDLHLPLLWSEAVRDEAFAIYDTFDLCFPDTKTNKSKTTTKMTTDNNCDHDTVREGVKSWMESVRSTTSSASVSASTSASASSSLESQNFLLKISVHALLLRRLLSSYRNEDEIITATLIPIFSLLRVSQSLLYLKKRPIQARFY